MSFSTNRFSRKALLLVTAVFSASLLWAQATGISGRVLDETGAPVIGATVMVKGTTIATATNVDGTFNLKNTGRNVTLVVSYVGYEAQQVASKGAGSVTITLKPEAIGMESVEIVSVGYGTQKRESVVGAISTIRPEELRVPVRSLSQTLAGNLAGVVALQTSGEPGKDDAQFWIRGIATFTGSPDPLILVDGIERPLNDVDPLEIESFSVLKDASATAVYGVRGANGVILVNTRRGFDGPARIDLRYEQGFSFASKRLSFVDAATRSEMFNEAVDAVNASAALKYGADEIKAMRMQTDPEVYPDVDWQKLLMKKVSLSEKVSANISGGGKFARYFTALSFYNQEGQYAVKPGKYSWVSDKIGRYGENVNYKRYNFRSNVDMDITKTTVVNLGVQGNVTENMEPVEGSAAIYRDIINAAPNAFPVRFKDGELAGRDGLNWIKEEMAQVTNLEKKAGPLSEQLKGADVFIGVSAPGMVTKEMVQTMNEKAIIFACANPTPEIFPDEAKAGGAAVVSTGRSDYPNQINNVLAFPGIFRGTFDVRASDINEEMKMAAAKALADLISDEELSADYIIPKAFDPRVGKAVAAAVAEAARASGVARI